MALKRFPVTLPCGENANCQAEVLRHGQEYAVEDAHLHPRFMAEEVCSDALLRHIRARRNKSIMHTAWSSLELGLTLPHLPEAAGDFFDYAEETFTDIYGASDKALIKLNAQLGITFMPAYRARYRGEQLSHRNLVSIHTDIANILETFDDLYDPKGLDKYAGVKPELVTLELFARLRSSDWLAYPASPREESTNLSTFNHDCYVIRRGLKIPVQVKRKNGSGYDKSVAVVRLHNIMERVNVARASQAVQVWGRKRKTTRPLRPLVPDDFAQLIVREAKGEWLTEHEEWLLELGSMAAVQEVMEKEAIIRDEYTQRSYGHVALAA